MKSLSTADTSKKPTLASVAYCEKKHIPSTNYSTGREPSVQNTRTHVNAEGEQNCLIFPNETGGIKEPHAGKYRVPKFLPAVIVRFDRWSLEMTSDERRPNFLPLFVEGLSIGRHLDVCSLTHIVGPPGIHLVH